MFRSFFIYLSKAAWARQMVTQWGVARRAASRFVAGETLAEAIHSVQVLNQNGINASLDHLGEHTTTAEEARMATQDILKAIAAIQQHSVRANVSIKLTQIGMALDRELCAENLRQILTYAREQANFVRIDMEDSCWVETTLGLFWQMRQKYGLTNAGVVIQAYLYRSEEDIRRIVQEGGTVRLCKGAYKEPPDIAYPEKRDVDKNYDRLAAILMDASKAQGTSASKDGKFPPVPGIASHDEKRLAYAKTYARKIGLPKEALEFQMLYGIRRDLQEQIAQEGYPVRVYVPYGTQWYPYFVRRLAERPANLWFFVSNFFKS